LELEGFDNTWNNRISSIGIVDGKLHVQQETPPPPNNMWSYVNFIITAPQGLQVEQFIGPHWPASIFSFRINENGDFINDDGDDSQLPYREDIYEVDLERLSEYSLVAFYHTEERIDINWDVSFEVNISDEGTELVADGLDIKLESYRVILREVRVTPYNVFIRADYIEALPVSPNPGIAINTTEGIVKPILGSMMFTNIFDDYNEQPVGFTIVRDLVEFNETDVRDIKLFDLDSVISIEIDGHTIQFK
jgi:hypothetical protein